jgi:hypothetical protein
MSELISNILSRRRLGLQVVTGAAAALAVSGSAEGAQVHMEAALRALNTAQQHLNEAEADKGGHRVKALSLVHDAIDEVKEGIRAGAGR